jgi:hypothetical protein
MRLYRFKVAAHGRDCELMLAILLWPYFLVIVSVELMSAFGGAN